MLDGWRAISICLVLAAHMLPLGPKTWQLNATAGALGMVIFFNLSGFLIVTLLLKSADIRAFLLKRCARIVPLAWLVSCLVLFFAQAPTSEWLANLLFYANLPPFYLEHTGHFWSLGVEVQFYVAVAFLVAISGQRALRIAIPIIAVCVTALRIATGAEISIVTWLRVDEILAGGMLALVVSAPTHPLHRLLARLPTVPLLCLCALSASPDGGGLNFARPYISAAMIGSTIASTGWLTKYLESAAAAYLAEISYAVYILHPYSMIGWLGSGTGLEKYAKRGLCFALTFGAAHASTFWFERPVNGWAHRIASRFDRRGEHQDPSQRCPCASRT